MESREHSPARPSRQDARALFDREPPPDYGLGWAEAMARLRQDPRERTVLAFRVGSERLAVDLRAVVSVNDWRPIRRVPHARDAALLGIAVIDGDLQLCVSLEVLFDLPRPDATRLPATARLVVIGRGDREWVVPVTETLGLRQVAFEDLSPTPATLRLSSSPYVRGLFAWDQHQVGVLDDDLLLGSLERRFP